MEAILGQLLTRGTHWVHLSALVYKLPDAEDQLSQVSEDQKNSSNQAEQRVLGSSRKEELELVLFLKTRIEIGSPANIAGTCSCVSKLPKSANCFPPS